MLDLIGMQFSNEVHWTGSNFLIARILLAIINLGIEMIFKFASTKKQKLFFLAIVLILGLLTWAEMAVGIFG